MELSQYSQLRISALIVLVARLKEKTFFPLVIRHKMDRNPTEKNRIRGSGWI